MENTVLYLSGSHRHSIVLYGWREAEEVKRKGGKKQGGCGGRKKESERGRGGEGEENGRDTRKVMKDEWRGKM